MSKPLCRLLAALILVSTPLLAQNWQLVKNFRGSGIPAPSMCANGADLGFTYTNRSNNGLSYVCRLVDNVYTWVSFSSGGDGTGVTVATADTNKILSNNGTATDWRTLGTGLVSDSSSMRVDSAVVALTYGTQTLAGTYTFSGPVTISGASATVDFTGALTSKPFKAGTTANAPATCTPKVDFYVQTDGILKQCNATGDGWDDAVGGPAAGTFSTGITVPETCTVGALFFKTDMVAPWQLLTCGATDTWRVYSGVRQGTFLIGAENGPELADADDQPDIFVNKLGVTVNILSVSCYSDAGTPSINLERNDGTAADILSSDLTCSTSGATSTSFTSGENSIANGHRINFKMVTAGGTAKRVTVTWIYEVQVQ